MSIAPDDLQPVVIRRAGRVSTLPIPPRALARPVPPTPSTPEHRRPHLRLVDDFGPEHTSLDSLPDPQAWVARVAVGLYEASVGLRPTTQVMRLLSPDEFDALMRRSARAARSGTVKRRPIRLRRVRATHVGGPHEGIVEACVVLDDHRHVRAMALRLEGLDGRWIITACEIG